MLPTGAGCKSGADDAVVRGKELLEQGERLVSRPPPVTRAPFPHGSPPVAQSAQAEAAAESALNQVRDEVTDAACDAMDLVVEKIDGGEDPRPGYIEAAIYRQAPHLRQSAFLVSQVKLVSEKLAEVTDYSAYGRLKKRVC